MRRTWLVAFALVALMTAAGLVRAQSPRNVNIAEALDMYERGERGVLTGFARLDAQTRVGVRLDLERLGPNWAKAKGEAARPRRLLMLAGFVLDLARAGGGDLLEWVCDKIRPPYGPKKPLPEELIWHHAVLAYFQGTTTGYRRIQTHLWHVARRYKDEPGIALAHSWMKLSEWENMSREAADGPSTLGDYRTTGDRVAPTSRWDELALAAEAAIPSSTIGPPAITRVSQTLGRVLAQPPVAQGNDGVTSVWTQPNVAKKVSDAVLNAYRRAASFSATTSEAELRLGYLLMVAGRLDEARPHLTRVRVESRQAGQRYLAELMTAWTEERANRLAEAERAYRRALSTRPSGRTAATWLAMLLQSQGKLAEAQAVIDASLEAPVTSPDPWPQFGQGEYKNFNDLVDKFREALWSGRSR